VLWSPIWRCIIVSKLCRSRLRLVGKPYSANLPCLELDYDQLEGILQTLKVTEETTIHLRAGEYEYESLEDL